MAGIELATAYVSILPSTKGLGGKITADLERQLGGSALTKTGAKLGKSLGAGVISGAQADISKLTRLAQDSAEKQIAASRKVEEAKRKEADAAGAVRVAEQKLADARDNAKVKASTLAAAEEDLAKKQRTLAAAQKSTTQSTEGLDKAREGAAQASNDLKKAESELSRQTQEGSKKQRLFGRALDDNAKKTGRLSDGAKKFGLALGAAGAAVGGFALKKGLDRALGIEDARAKLRGLGNDAKTVNKVMDSALKSVKGTAFGLDEAATVAAGAVAAGIKPGQQLTKYLSQTADAATIAGTSLGEMGSIFNKVQTNGVAYTDDLQQLADRGIPIFQYLRKEYGVSAVELRKMVEKGKVDSATYAKVIKQNLGGAALESGNTTRGAFKNLGASLGRIGEGLISGVFANVKGGAQGITTALAPMESGARTAGQALGTVVSSLSSGVRFLVEYKAALVPIAAGLIAYKTATLAVAAAQRIQAISAGAAAAQTTFLNFALRANPIGLVITALTALGVGLVIAYKRSETFRNIVNGAWSAIKTGITVMWSFVQPILARFGEFLGKIIPPVVTALGVLFRVYFAAISTYIKVWWTITSNIFGLFVSFLKTRLFPTIAFLYTRVFKPYFEAIGAVVGFVWKNGIKPVFGAIINRVDDVRGAIGGAVSSIRTVWSGLKEAFSGPVDWVLRNVINPLVKAIDDVSQFLVGKKLIGKSFGLNIKSDTRAGGGKASGMARNGGFAGGGWTGPGARMTPAGVVHADEFVVKKSSRRKVESTNPGLLDHINRTGSVAGYAAGGRVKPLAGGTPSTYAGHTGVDFNAPNDFGKPIMAAASGVVSLVKHLKTSYGNYVQLTHPGGTRTIYGHMSQTLARVGQQVAAGQTIGKVGSTGNSTGPHLHFEVRPGGTYASSMAFLAGAKSVGATGAAASGMDPLSTIKSKIAQIRKGIGGNSIVKAFGSGSLSKLGAQAIDWVKGKADSAASLLSPGYAVGKAVLAKVNGGNAKSAAKGALGGYGWGADQFSPLNKLWTRESNWNPRAQNPKSSAYGIPQALPGSKMASAGSDWRTNAGTQIKWGLNYIKQRYGSPAAAWAHSQRTGWYANGGRVREGVYDRGGVIKPGSTMVRNKSKKPEALLSASQWKAIQKLAGISDRNRRLSLDTVNSRLKGQPLPYTLTKKAEKQKKAIDKLERQYDKARTKAERKKIAAEIKTAKTELGKTRDQRETVRKLIDQRRRIEIRQAKALPSQLTNAQRGQLLGKYNGLTIGSGAGVSSGFLSGQLGILPKSADQLQREFQSARAGSVSANQRVLTANRSAGIAQANARPVQERLAQVNATLAQAKGSDVLRESFRKESATIKQLVKQRSKADSEKEAKKIQKRIDVARLRQLALTKERKANRSLAAEKRRLENDRRLKNLTAAQKAQTAAVAAATAADEKATAAAEAYRAAQDAAIEKATSIRDAGIGLGSLSSATSKTSGGVLSNLKRSISTVGTWGAVASALIKGGLRGPIMEEFLTAGPSKDAVRLGRSLLSGGKIGEINSLQSQLRAEATNAGSISGAYLANPGALAVSRPGVYSAAVAASGQQTPTAVVEIHGMTHEASQDVARKSADIVDRRLAGLL